MNPLWGQRLPFADMTHTIASAMRGTLLSAVSKLASVFLLFAACASPTTPDEPSGLVHIPSAVVVVGSSIGVELVPAPVFLLLQNESADSTAVRYSRCSFAVRGYRTASRLGAPDWVRVLPEHTNCGAEIALELPVRGHALTVSEIGHVPQELLSRAPFLSLLFHVAGEATPRAISVAPIAID